MKSKISTELKTLVPIRTKRRSGPSNTISQTQKKQLQAMLAVSAKVGLKTCPVVLKSQLYRLLFIDARKYALFFFLFSVETFQKLQQLLTK